MVSAWARSGLSKSVSCTFIAEAVVSRRVIARGAGADLRQCGAHGSLLGVGNTGASARVITGRACTNLGKSLCDGRYWKWQKHRQTHCNDTEACHALHITDLG